MRFPSEVEYRLPYYPGWRGPLARLGVRLPKWRVLRLSGVEIRNGRIVGNDYVYDIHFENLEEVSV